MHHTALKLRMPYYIIDYNNVLTLYGQGKNGILFDGPSSQFESNNSAKLHKNKNQAANILSALGHPSQKRAIVGINASSDVSEKHISNFLGNQFSERNGGRIDTLLIMTNNNNFAQAHYNRIREKHACPAFSNSSLQ